MVKERKAFSHKCSKIIGIKIWDTNIHKELVRLDHSCSSGQQNCSDISLKDGGTRNPELSHQITITAEYFRSKLNAGADWPFRNAADSSDWKLHQLSFSWKFQTLGNPNSRSVCFQAVSPTFPIYGMEAISKQFWNRYNTAGLEQNVCFGIPTFQPDRSRDERGPWKKSRNDNTSDTHLADTTLVYSPTKNVHKKPIAFTRPTKPFTKSPKKKTSSGENQVPKVDDVENYRKTLEWNEFQAMQLNLSSCPGDQVKSQITNWPETIRFSGVLENKSCAPEAEQSKSTDWFLYVRDFRHERV